MASYSIRAVVLHLSNSVFKGNVVELIDDKISRLLELRDELSSGFDLDIGMVRITLPDTKPGEGSDLAVKLGKIAGEYSNAIISIGGISSRDPRLEEVIESVVSNGLFASIMLEELNWDEAVKVSEIIHNISGLDHNYPVNIGVNLLGKHIVTPYFPLSSSPGHSDLVTVALTYPNYLTEGYRRGGYRGLVDAVTKAGGMAEKIALEASSRLNAEYGGVDLSVAPWMSESTLGLVEQVAGTRMPQPGFSWGIYLVNRALKDAGSNLRLTTGFNEVQLPIAEDLKLKARASEGDLRARDLARFAGVCLAGLDLAVVPADVNGVAGLILETGAYARSKDRVLGLRIIPVEGVEPGDKVYLDRFGETPVIEI
ncbi:MAG: DUF711 family protein [Desulfurococcales archaeon]|nr:DUF711 family protein [Desulfurococcales archaeon]